ncbi:MAG: hypothetical protein K1X53_17005 [Candidatus Sumerlaeaceae bacterium]|nr:hypothetical protein [Candidatus Sumerlaeaceae bacterium]
MNYAKVVERSLNGDSDAIHMLCTLGKWTDGAGAQSHASIMWLLLHTMADSDFACAACCLGKSDRTHVLNDFEFEAGMETPAFKAYMRRWFPESYKVLKN